MAYVRLDRVNVTIPIFDTHTRRLFKVPSLGHAKVGTNTVSASSGAIILHAVKNLSLQLSEGDRVCLIGHNGAGKTTLLRLVARIYPPSSGTVEIIGKLFALLGSNTALNEDATGYENIKLMANLYDWPKARLADYVHDVEDFTELGEYLDLPTRVYSAGMKARLAFAMATTRSADILLIDEGIGAGDQQFQDKAQERVQQFIGRAKIILFASHSAQFCRAICNKGLLLAKGEQVYFGGIDEAFARYAQLA